MPRFLFAGIALLAALGALVWLQQQGPRMHDTAIILPGAENRGLVKSTLKGQRAGLIVNQSSRVGEAHLIDSLKNDGITITKLFAVEHGIRGTHDAGARINNGLDQASGLPITSIYGKKKAPDKQDALGVDIFVFDLQDVGVRFYTYLSSLHYIMESCARYNTPLVILDRPNPNIAYVDGPILELEFQSFVGMHPIPLLHGMTLGELAQMINGEGWLEGGLTCDLTVIPVQNYTRTSRYNLPVKPSPNLPNQHSIALYPSLALFEASNVSVGRGTNFPFQVLGGTHSSYGDFSFTPSPKPGAALRPKHMGETLHGQDLRSAAITGLDITLFLDWHARAQSLGEDFLTRPGWLDKLMGTDSFRKQVQSGQSEHEIRSSWRSGLADFKTKRAPYLLYPSENGAPIAPVD